jgi:hypothetical protein
MEATKISICITDLGAAKSVGMCYAVKNGLGVVAVDKSLSVGDAYAMLRELLTETELAHVGETWHCNSYQSKR